MSHVFKEQRPHHYILIFLVLAGTVMLKAYYFPEAYLSEDGCNYLGLAQNLLDHGNFEFNSFASDKPKAHFAVWPVGYSLLIAAVAKISGVPVYYSAKLVNLLLIVSVMFILYKKFPGESAVYASSLLLYPFVLIFTFTLTEGLFILGMLMLALNIKSLFEEDQVSISRILWLFANVIVLFLSRYIGYFSVFLFAFLLLWFFFTKKYKNAFVLFCTCFLSSAFILGYLYINYTQTGFLTGMPRFATRETFVEFALMVGKGVLEETNLLSIGFGYSAISIIIFTTTYLVQWCTVGAFLRDFKLYEFKDRIYGGEVTLFTGLIIAGGFYILFIIINRYFTYFSDLNWRFLFPGSFLIILAIIVYSTTLLSSRLKDQFKKSVITISLMSFCFNNLLFLAKYYRDNGFTIETYPEISERILEVTRNIPAGSVIVFGDRNLLYLRNDLYITSPYYLPFLPQKERWEDFLERASNKYGDSEMYVMIKGSNYFKSFDDEQLRNIYDPSVYSIIQQNRDKTFIRIDKKGS